MAVGDGAAIDVETDPDRWLRVHRTVMKTTDMLLLGLALNATLGWAWADPVAALIIAVAAVREGRGAWRGQVCCATPAPPPADKESDADRAGAHEACCASNSGLETR